MKNDGVRQWEGLFPYVYNYIIIYIYILWNIKFMFETTNQIMFITNKHRIPSTNCWDPIPPSPSLRLVALRPPPWHLWHCEARSLHPPGRLI